MEKETAGRIVLPEGAAKVVRGLSEAGFEAYVVGGCVRDALIGRVPGDWDITTNARPEQVKALFPVTIDTGLAHGTVTVMVEHVGYEVTTYRIDGKYSDGRHPDSVSFAGQLSEDLARRDFTINAMAYHPKTGVTDLYGGMEDLSRGIIRSVGDPEKRFQEDALRLMRAVRFSAQLGFTIEEKTKEAIQKLSATLTRVSRERIAVELVKLLCSPNPGRVRDLCDLGLSDEFLPDFKSCIGFPQDTPYHIYDVGEHIIKVIEAVPPVKHLRLAALFHDMGKPACHTVDEKNIAHFKGHALLSEKLARRDLTALKLDKATIDRVCRLIRYHDHDILRHHIPKEKHVRRFLYEIGPDLYEDLMCLMRADNLAKSAYTIEKTDPVLARIEELHTLIIERGDCLSLKELAVNGEDLVALGYKKGPGLGQELTRLLQLVLSDETLNRRDFLLAEAKRNQTEKK